MLTIKSIDKLVSTVKFVKFITFSFAALMLLLSFAAAVWGYGVVDSSDFKLVISGVAVESKDTLRFDVYARGAVDYDYRNLHSYEVKFDDDSVTTKFAHSLDNPIAVIGSLKAGNTQLFTLPFDPEQKTGKFLSCGAPLSISLFSVKGKMVGSWLGIPECEIQKPRPVGLVKLSDSVAEYKAGQLKITWELVDADPDSQSISLKKQSGALKPETKWYSAGQCPDVESGKCMTEFSAYFTCDHVNVLLSDKRQGTSVILNKMFSETESVATDPALSTDVIAPTDAKLAGNVSGDVSISDDDSDITAKPAAIAGEQVRVCLEGCASGSQCFESGTHNIIIDMPVYCEGHSWLVQKKDGKKCAKDYECVSNSCGSGVCAGVKQETEASGQMNIIYRVLQWIDNLI